MSIDAASKKASCYRASYQFPFSLLIQGTNPTRHRYEHPCVATIKCTFDSAEEEDNTGLWKLMGLIAGCLVALMVIIFCCFYAVKNCGGRGAGSEPISPIR